MPGSVFVSWSSEDTIARSLIERLRDAGLPVVEYRDNMRAGESISGSISNAIDEATAAVVFVSAETVKRDWLRTELTLIWDRHRRRQYDPWIIVRLGPIQDEDFPNVIHSEDRRFYDMAATTIDEDALKRLVRDVLEGLGEQRPLVILAALLAMTKSESEEVLNDQAAVRSLELLCTTAGVPSGEILGTLRQRYGDTANDYKPFPEKRLVDLVQSVIRTANLERVAKALATIHLRWCSEDLFRREYKQRDALRRQWSNGYSLTLVDSVSTFHQNVWARFQDLPEPRQSVMNGLVWLPPYTFHTCHIVELIDKILEARHVKLHDRFDAWRHRSGWEPYLAFDIGNDIYLWRLLYQMLTSIALPEEPNTEKTRAVDAAFRGQETQVIVSKFFR